jgi:hypothetical protein
MDDAKLEVLAFTAFPHALAQDLLDQPLQQVNEEIIRLSSRGLPNSAAVIRLVGAILIDMHDEWIAGDRRYLSEGSMALIDVHQTTAPAGRWSPQNASRLIRPRDLIVECACSATDRTSVATFTMFCQLLAATAANAALTTGAVGGVFLAGVIVRRFPDFVAQSGLRERFTKHPRADGYLQQIATLIVATPEPGCSGHAPAGRSREPGIRLRLVPARLADVARLWWCRQTLMVRLTRSRKQPNRKLPRHINTHGSRPVDRHHRSLDAHTPLFRCLCCPGLAPVRRRMWRLVVRRTAQCGVQQ